MTEWTVTATRWDGPRLDLHVRDQEETSTIHWEADRPFRWTVGATVQAPDTPRYVFEPRPVDAIRKDLDHAVSKTERDAIAAELRLCDQPHVTYIAFYGTLPKVGMTSKERLPQRLREQGADAGFAVATTPDRAGARDLEASISFQHRIPQWRTHKEILPQWTRPVDVERIKERADDVRARLGVTDTDAGLVCITDHPLPVLAQRPHRALAAGTHAGASVGAKGNYIVYRPDRQDGRLDVGHAPLAALKHTDLIGRTLTTHDDD